jgi:hypothetical protein
MNATMKSFLAAGCLFAVSCSGDSDSNKGDSVPVATPAPAPTETPAPAEPAGKGFQFIDAAETKLPVYVRGDMNGWLGENVTEELLAASRLNFDESSGCYVGTMSLEAGETPFRLATYLSESAGNGWEYLKVGLGAAKETKSLTLGEETKVDVYYFPAGDANGKDFGGGGNFAVNFPKQGNYEFKFCTQVDDYTQSTLTVSAR